MRHSYWLLAALGMSCATAATPTIPTATPPTTAATEASERDVACEPQQPQHIDRIAFDEQLSSSLHAQRSEEAAAECTEMVPEFSPPEPTETAVIDACRDAVRTEVCRTECALFNVTAVAWKHLDDAAELAKTFLSAVAAKGCDTSDATALVSCLGASSLVVPNSFQVARGPQEDIVGIQFDVRPYHAMKARVRAEYPPDGCGTAAEWSSFVEYGLPLE